MMKRLLLGALVLGGLGGCILGGGGTEGAGDGGWAGILVRVVDSTGAPFGADSVYWSYQADPATTHKSAHGSDTAMKGAKRLDAAGTRWAIAHAGLHGAVFIRGAYSRPDSLNPAFCALTAYTQREASAAVLPDTVELVLKPARLCL